MNCLDIKIAIGNVPIRKDKEPIRALFFMKGGGVCDRKVEWIYVLIL